MSITRKNLGANFPGVGETPLHGGKSQAQALLAPVLLLVAMFIGILLAFQSNDVSYRFQMISLGLALGALGVALICWQVSVTVGVVRLESRGPSLRFSYAPILDLLYPIAALFIILPATPPLLAQLRGETVAQIGFGRRTVYVFGVLGLVFLLQQLWALRVSRGLQLTAEGIRGVRGLGRIHLNWEDLGAASVISTRTGSKLSLRVKSGQVIVVSPRLIGSDPDAVAAIINYYLQHPAEREHLTDPETAIQLVAQSS